MSELFKFCERFDGFSSKSETEQRQKNLTNLSVYDNSYITISAMVDAQKKIRGKVL